MKYFLFLITLKLGVYNFVNAQFVFDYKIHFDSISELTQSKKSEYNYAKLLSRFDKADATLNSKEILFLMIGETQKKKYLPYEWIEIERDIIDLINKKKYPDALSKCNYLLDISPLNFTALMQKAFILSIDIENSNEKSIANFKFVKVLDAILYSGEGTINSPIFVLSPFDGQIITQLIFGLNTGKMNSFENSNGFFIDEIEIISQKDGEPNIYMYFMIDHAVKKMFNQDILNDFEKELKKSEKKSKRNS